MQILQVKTAADFQNVTPPDGAILIWPQIINDAITLHAKTPDGDISVLSGGISPEQDEFNADVAANLASLEEKTKGTIKDINGATPDKNGHIEIDVSSGVSALSDLSDVSDLSEASEGQALVYNEASGTWKPGSISGTGSGGASNLPDPAAAPAMGLGIGIDGTDRGNNANTGVLLHFDEMPFVNDAVGSTSTVNVANGGSVVLSDIGKFNKSAYFPGFLSDGVTRDSNSYLTIDYSALYLNSADCRIDLFFLPDGTQPSPYSIVFSTYLDAQDNNDFLEVGFEHSSILIQIGRDYATLNAGGFFNYVSFVRHNNLWYAFLNGTKVLGPSSLTLGSTGLMKFGGRVYKSDARMFKGWIDEFRIQFGDMSAFTGDTIPVPTASYTPTEAAYVFPTPVADIAEVPNDALIQLAFNGKPRSMTLAQLRTLLQ